ncbi:hypothetical protein CJ030_MR3G012251 [Morella rubra]|uniref:Uncharacterized protein n=1 Tax=Morella rubra TaxID=262757 RepID=A0A6A1W2Z2_9ROSI|nr:hypothetical protein CJ030_MR3G012251 [Morella rubra]
MDGMMLELIQWMQSIMLPTHEMVSDVSGWLTVLERKVADMDCGWEKKVAAIQEVLKSVATSPELFSLTEQVGLIEEHLCQVCQVLKLTDDDDHEQ